MTILSQGPFYPASGFTFTSGIYNSSFNWHSQSQPTISPPNWPSAILTNDGPNGGTGNFAIHHLTNSELETNYSDLFAVCQFGFNLPRNSTVRGVKVEIDGVSSGTAGGVFFNDVLHDSGTFFDLVQLTVSGGGSNQIPVIPFSGVEYNIGAPPNRQYLLFAHPDTHERTGIFGGENSLWGLQDYIQSDKSVSGVGHDMFGFAFSVRQPDIVGDNRIPSGTSLSTYLDSARMTVYYECANLTEQGPFSCTSGITFGSGSFNNPSVNWFSNAQSPFMPGLPSAIFIDDAPNGSNDNPHVKWNFTNIIPSSNMIAVCRFGFNVPNTAMLHGARVWIEGLQSGIDPFARIEAVYLTTSGNYNDGLTIISGVPVIGLSQNMLTPGPTGFIFGHPAINEDSGIFGCECCDFWGLEYYLTPDDGPSGVNHPCFGVAFGVVNRATGIPPHSNTVYIDNVKMSLFYSLPDNPASSTFIATSTMGAGAIRNSIGGFVLNAPVSLTFDSIIGLSNNIPLYISGGPIKQSLPLFLKALPLSSISGSLNLNIYGDSGVPIQFGGLDLFINGAAVTGFLPLFIHADINPTGFLPLYISGAADTISNSLQLYLQNNGISGGLQLFIQGLQLTQGFHLQYPSDGYIPITGSLPLYIQRGEYGVLPLYIAGHLDSSGSLNLYLQSEATVNSGLNLFNVGGIDNIDNSLKLFSHGGFHLS